MGEAEVLTAESIGVGFTSSNGGVLPVVQGISLSVSRGNILAVVGPSGCGKSTLLRVLAGVQAPTTGRVIYFGGAAHHRRPPIPMVFQSPALLPWLSVLENIEAPLLMQGRSPEPGAVENLLAMMELTSYADYYPRQLSGGMRARVSLARAMLVAEHLLFLDEAFSGLDEPLRHGLNHLFRKYIEERELAAIVVTHSLEEAVYIADSVVVLSRRPARISAIFPITASQPRSQVPRADPALMQAVEHLRVKTREFWSIPHL